MTQLTRDISAGVIILGGFFVAYLALTQFMACKKTYRWIYLVNILAGLCTAILLLGSLLRIYNGADTISPMFGRPVYIILLLALSLGAIHNRKITGGC